MAWAISILQRRRQRQVRCDDVGRAGFMFQIHIIIIILSKDISVFHSSNVSEKLEFLFFDRLQEAAALAATEVAFMLQAAQGQSLQFTLAPGPVVTPHPEPLQ